MQAPSEEIYGKSTRNIMLKSTCNGQYESVFIRLAVVVSQICEIPWNSPTITTYGSSRLSKVIDFDANRKRMCNFLL